MPIYEYQCRECGSTTETLERLVSNPPRTRLPKCCGTTMRKVISKSSFQLRGDGWAKDGYQKPEKGKE